MTTVTKTKPTTSVTAELEQLEEAKAKAQTEARQAKVAVEDWERETKEMRLALSIHLQSHPSEFDGGRAKPGTEAARLEEAIKERMRGENPHLLDHQQATAKFHRTDALLEQFKVSRIADRLAELDPDHDAAEQAIRDAAGALAEACSQYASGVERVRAIIATTPTLERGSEPSLAFDGRVQEWHALALDIQDTEVLAPGLSEVAEWKLEQHHG